MQFSYFGATADPDMPAWVLEGSAAALENRVYPELDDIVASLQLRAWFAAPDRPITDQSYGARLLWQYLDESYPALLPAFLTRLAGAPVGGAGRDAFADIVARVTGSPFDGVFLRYAVRVADEYAERIRPRARVGRRGHRSTVARSASTIWPSRREAPSASGSRGGVRRRR